MAAATSIASSRCAHSITTTPPIRSLVSACGPSDTSVSPRRTCTFVVAAGRSRAPNTRRARTSASQARCSGHASISSGDSECSAPCQITNAYLTYHTSDVNPPV